MGLSVLLRLGASCKWLQILIFRRILCSAPVSFSVDLPDLAGPAALKSRSPEQQKDGETFGQRAPRSRPAPARLLRRAGF